MSKVSDRETQQISQSFEGTEAFIELITSQEPSLVHMILQKSLIESIPNLYGARAVTRPKIFKIGRAISEGASDQLVAATAIADTFEVEEAIARENSGQVVTFTESAELQLLAEKHFRIRHAGRSVSSD